MIEAVKKLPFWNDLSPYEKSLCEMSAVIHEYRAGSYLLGNCDNQSCLGMLHILFGEARAFIVSEEGREITLFKLRAGDNCVLSASCVLSKITFETHLNVTRNAEVLVLPSAIFGKLMENNIHVRAFTYELATERFSTVMWVMQQIIFFRFDKRLANFLLAEYERTKSKEIRMTQEEIAIATNSAREVVARMIKQFSVDGLIESKRGIILLKDIKGIENLK